MNNTYSLSMAPTGYCQPGQGYTVYSIPCTILYYTVYGTLDMLYTIQDTVYYILLGSHTLEDRESRKTAQ